jgi:hypothetical protein
MSNDRTLPASLQHFTTVKDSENPCCEPTIFYTVDCPLFPCCDPTIFYAVVWTASKAQLRKERRERNPCRDPYAVLYTLTFVHG